MTSSSAHGPLSTASPEALSRVRDVLRGAGYSSRGLAELVGAPPGQAVLDTIDPIHFLLRPRDDAPLGVLARLFVADAEVELDTFRRAVAPSSVDDWLALGLVEVHDARVTGLVSLATSGELVLANDRLRRVFCNDYVMGTGTSTRTLDQLTVRRPSGRTLDVGTGSGILALHAAAHSEQVVAIDKNPRAVNMAAFNAALNDCANVGVVEGDLFAPVEGQHFDLVVTNPPFIISPESGRIYRDGGLRGDDLAQSIVRKVPSFLREGGFAQIVCDWSAIGSKSWQRRLRSWFEGNGCDVWVLRIAGLEAAKYAAFQVRGVSTPDETTDALTKRYDEWLAYYEHEGIEAIHHGVITMRRRSAHENWLRIDDAPEMSGPCGDDVLEAFAARDFLEAPGGEQRMMETRFRASPALLCEETLAPNHPLGPRSTCTLRRARGLLYTADVDPGLLTLVSELDGARTLLEALMALGKASGERLDVLVRQHVPKMRDLILRGFIVPVAP
jgi:SAM-dependent methyltransferase